MENCSVYGASGRRFEAKVSSDVIPGKCDVIWPRIFYEMINRYNLLMGWVYVRWPYVFSRNLLTEVLLEPMSLLYSSRTWQRSFVWLDSLAVANVCKLSLGVFSYQAPVLSTSLEGDFSISLPSHLVCRSIVEYTAWGRKADTALVLGRPWDCTSLQNSLRKWR